MDEKRRKKIIKLLNHPIFDLGNVSERSLQLYDQALTHRSYAKEQEDKKIQCVDNERLEFLGNFVLGLVVSEYLYEEFSYSEGEMTVRMEVVSDAKLAEIITKSEVGRDNMHILLGKRELGRTSKLEDSILAGALEAFIGAVYLDQGLKKVRKIIINLFGSEINDFDPTRNYIGRLQELVQKKKLGKMKYVESRLTGPDHRPTFQAVVKISGKTYGKGVGKNKKAAKMDAAKIALKKLGKVKSSTNC